MAEQLGSRDPYVFLSYTTPDRERVLTLADCLEASGIQVWVDRRNIAGGTAWDEVIVEAIRHCTVLVVLCSQAAMQSPNVLQELRLAQQYRKPALPLFLEPVTYPPAMEYILAGRQWVELRDGPEETWLPDVLRALAGLGLLPVRGAGVPAEPAAPAVVPRTNLPVPLTRLIGREQELTEVTRLLQANRLLTLTGPGGTGKTRLALQAASLQAAAYPDGVFFVDLAPLQDPNLVPSAIAQSLGVPGLPEVPLRESVLRSLRGRRLLLLLDNYEHLLAAAEFAGALLHAGPAVALLVTSRAPLRIRGEREYAVPPLPLPTQAAATAAAVEENPAVALFVARAEDVRADFVLTDANAGTVAAICARLDGLPLAIELAAARVRALPPAALLTRLAQRLPVLTGGTRDVPARQQTLRNTIAWSYALLEPGEQRLFRRLGVFAGGCTLEAIEAIGDAGTSDLAVLDEVTSLVEKSLLQREVGPGGEARFTMLQTLREFALDELQASGEQEEIYRRHLELFLQFAVTAGHGLRTPERNHWVARLEQEHDNLRTALAWSIDQSPPDVALRLAGALIWFWDGRGYEREGHEWANRILAAPGAAGRTAARAVVLRLAARLSWRMNDAGRARRLLDESVAIWRELGDAHGLAVALTWRVLVCSLLAEHEAARADADEALATWPFDDPWERGDMLHHFGHLAQWTGKLVEAEGHYQESAALLRAVGDRRTLAQLLLDLGNVAADRGDYSAAHPLYEDSLQTFIKFGDDYFVHMARLSIGLLALRMGELVEARRLFAELVQRCLAIGLPGRAVTALFGLVAVHIRLGDPRLAARLAGALEHYQAEMSVTASLPEHFELRRLAIEPVREALGDAAYAAASAEGKALSFDEVVAVALAEDVG